MPLAQNKTCPQCGKEMTTASKFCSRSCVGKHARRGQLAWEQKMAEQMVAEGWEIMSPTACCDRIGIKDGRLYLLEFKPEGRTDLRTFQKSVQDVAPGMYRVVSGTKDARISDVHGFRRRKYQRKRKGRAGTSSFLGVSWSQHMRKWRSKTYLDGKHVHIGYFDSEEAAARSYEDAVRF